MTPIHHTPYFELPYLGIECDLDGQPADNTAERKRMNRERRELSKHRTLTRKQARAAKRTGYVD